MACIERLREPIAQEQLIKLVRERVAKETDSQVAAAVVLATVTAGQGLGFSRAMLFARQTTELLVKLTVGPLRRAEAEEGWAKARAASSQIPQKSREPASAHAERVLHMFIRFRRLWVPVSSRMVLGPRRNCGHLRRTRRVSRLVRRLPLARQYGCDRYIRAFDEAFKRVGEIGRAVDPRCFAARDDWVEHRDLLASFDVSDAHVVLLFQSNTAKLMLGVVVRDRDFGVRQEPRERVAIVERLCDRFAHLAFRKMQRLLLLKPLKESLDGRSASRLLGVVT